MARTPGPLVQNPQKVALPSQAANQTARVESIKKKREQLSYNYEILPKLALAKGLPEFVELSDAYIMERLNKSIPLQTNAAMVKARQIFDLVNRMEDYSDYFIQVDKPTLLGKWRDDEFFGEQRLSGANPMIIQKLERDDPRAEVLEDLDLSFSVNSELSKGNIYVCDYTGTDPTYRGPVMVTGGTSKDGAKKWLPKPLAWFRWESDKSSKVGGRMMPLAIQLDASVDPVTYTRKNSRVYTPNEQHPMDWLFAKICVQCADSLHHEMSSHLARCHFTMEPIAVAVHRTIADEHPIALLLNTHMRFHIANDSVAAYTLIADAPQGNVKDLMPGTLRESMALLTESYDKWDLLGMNFTNDLYNRMLHDDDRLPHFPYRDDGKLIWGIIEEWVDSYVKAFYKSDADVLNDLELQDFAKECVDQKSGARVKGMPQQIERCSDLVDILTSIIFVCGPGHGAINFSQYEYMAFTPNMPLAVYQDVQLLADQDAPITEQQLMAILPNGEHAQRQLEIIFGLTAYKFDKFGDYDRTFLEWFGETYEEHMKGNKDVIKAYKHFQDKLKDAEKKIEKRNKDRPNPYPYMMPSEMLNSVSI